MQIASIETNVEKRIRANMKECLPCSKNDDTMMDAAVDERVTHLEEKVHALTDNLNQLTGSQQQQAHNTQVVQQVQALKVRADQQEHVMATMLDQKMEEQMSRIEALLTNKGSKTAAE